MTGTLHVYIFGKRIEKKESFLEWEMFQTRGVGNENTNFYRKSCRLWVNVDEYSGAWPATYDSRMLRKEDATCILGN